MKKNIKSIILYIFCLTLILNLFIISAFSVSAVNNPEKVMEVPYKSATIDGIVSSGEYDGATKLTLNISDTSKWSDGIVGDVAKAFNDSDSDFTVSIRMMYKDGFIYYLEERTDKTPNYRSADPTKAYEQDGVLLWFVNAFKKDSNPDMISTFARLDNSNNPLYNTYKNKPLFVHAKDGQQGGGKPVECESKSTFTSNGHVLEAKIDISKIGLTEKDLALNHIRTSFVAVNIFNDDFNSGKTKLWEGYGYQAQYSGINSWKNKNFTSTLQLKLTGKTYDYEETESEAVVSTPKLDNKVNTPSKTSSVNSTVSKNSASVKDTTSKVVSENTKETDKTTTDKEEVSTNNLETNSDNSAPKDETDSTLIIVIIVVSVVVLAAAATVAVILIKKKKSK